MPISHTNLVILNYLSVYIGWGTSYLAIRFAVEMFSPAAVMGTRFLLASIIMGSIALFRHKKKKYPSPTPSDLALTACLGVLVLVGGTGLVGYAEQSIPSGITAIVVGCTPLMFALFNRLILGGTMTVHQGVGCALGIAGVWILGAVGSSDANIPFSFLGLTLLILAMTSWSLGSIIIKRIALPMDPWLVISVQHIASAVVMFGFGIANHEITLRSLAEMPSTALFSILYLVMISCVPYTSYTWLLKHEPPERVSTYAFVNPAIAVLLGIALDNEIFNSQVALALFLTTLGTAITLFGAPHQWLKKVLAARTKKEIAPTQPPISSNP